MDDIPFRLRAYSHRWCVDNGLPSQLPDELKPKAERIYPRIVDAVGIAVAAKSGDDGKAKLGALVRESMEHAVLEAYADGVKDPRLIQAMMMRARTRTFDKLLG
jgi:hypothetical protein